MGNGNPHLSWAMLLGSTEEQMIESGIVVALTLPVWKKTFWGLAALTPSSSYGTPVYAPCKGCSHPYLATMDVSGLPKAMLVIPKLALGKLADLHATAQHCRSANLWPGSNMVILEGLSSTGMCCIDEQGDMASCCRWGISCAQPPCLVYLIVDGLDITAGVRGSVWCVIHCMQWSWVSRESV